MMMHAPTMPVSVVVRLDTVMVSAMMAMGLAVVCLSTVVTFTTMVLAAVVVLHLDHERIRNCAHRIGADRRGGCRREQ